MMSGRALRSAIAHSGPRGFERRVALRGLAGALVLPWLEALPLGRSFGQTASAAPLRMAFFFLPNGVHAPDWVVPAGARDDAVPPLLAPLAPLRKHLTLVRGLAHVNAQALGDGPGDHARSGACFLTGMHPRKTSGEDISAGVSVDQVAARALQGETAMRSLELGCEESSRGGDCDSGYSCAYSSNISWTDPGSPRPKETNPRRLFERLVGWRQGELPHERAARIAQRRSVLDMALADARALRRSISGSDAGRIESYMESVREIERAIERSEQLQMDPEAAGVTLPAGQVVDYGARVRLMADLLILAWRLDLTRVATFMFGNEGTGRTYPEIGVTDGHHHLTHHAGNAEMIEKVRRINLYQAELFGHFVRGLESATEDGRSLLDRSMIVLGAGITDGNVHDHQDLPVLLAGGAGGAWRSGRTLHVPKGTPMCNLYMSMLESIGAGQSRFGDSTGTLGGLG